MLSGKYLLKSSFLLVPAFVIFAAVYSTGSVNAATPTIDPLTKQLVNLAQTKIDTENDVLISGDASNLTKPNPALDGVAATQLRRNKMLADHGQRYTKVISVISPEKVDIVNGNATITATENVTPNTY